MVEVKFDKKTKKFSIVDEAEGTIGASRQITRFKQFCLPKLEQQKDIIFYKTFTSTDFDIIKEYNFKFIYAADSDRFIKLFFESTEN